MQTYSHYIITATLGRIWGKREAETGTLSFAGYELPSFKKKTFLLGSVTPDLLLTLIAIVAIGYDLIRGVEFGPDIESTDSAASWLFNYAFFNVWWVKAAQNLFHAPLLVLSYIAIGYVAWRYGRQWGAYLFWLATASLIHTAIDIPLHYDDGPLLLFPFNATTRFYSPVSYWDPNRYGTIAASIEHIFVLGLLIYLIWDWRKNRPQTSESDTS
ncbi:MAG: hypothetical protein AAF629_02895 [Chloroflexota bacterium]